MKLFITALASWLLLVAIQGYARWHAWEMLEMEATRKRTLAKIQAQIAVIQDARQDGEPL